MDDVAGAVSFFTSTELYLFGHLVLHENSAMQQNRNIFGRNDEDIDEMATIWRNRQQHL